jgi:hypothetical protein
VSVAAPDDDAVSVLPQPAKASAPQIIAAARMVLMVFFMLKISLSFDQRFLGGFMYIHFFARLHVNILQSSC